MNERYFVESHGPAPNPDQRSALTSPPSAAQLGGGGSVPFIRFPFYPTAPYYSTNPAVGYQVRFYSTGIRSTDPDYVVGTETVRTTQFDIPCRLIAINAAAIDEVTPALLGNDGLNTFLYRAEYTTGDKLHVEARLGSTVLGNSQNPGELGGHGYNIDQGATLVSGVTPLFTNLRIDITFVCLEIRGPRNFTPGY